jgi:hypothetical protein
MPRHYKTLHFQEYRAARERSRKTDKRSLTAHWQEGRLYARYQEPIVDIAFDVDISPSTVSSHIALYDMFPTKDELLTAAEHYHCYSFMRLMRLHSGTEHSRHLAIWACAVCGSRELRRVSEEEEEDTGAGGNVLTPTFKAAK